MEENPIIPFDEIINTTKASFAAIESLKEGKWIFNKNKIIYKYYKI